MTQKLVYVTVKPLNHAINVGSITNYINNGLVVIIVFCINFLLKLKGFPV